MLTTLLSVDVAVNLDIDSTAPTFSVDQILKLTTEPIRVSETEKEFHSALHCRQHSCGFGQPHNPSIFQLILEGCRSLAGSSIFKIEVGDLE